MSSDVSALINIGEGAEDHRYTYTAMIESVYDGDTITASVSLGFDLWHHKQKFRLYGIDTPEVRGPERPEGIEARDWLRSRLPPGTEVVIKSHKHRRGKYGRYLATVFKDGVNLNAAMVELGYAEVNFYGDPPGESRG